jgi:hypothetical protein
MVMACTVASLVACSTPGQNEVVDIEKLLPEGAVAEITYAYPDFKVTLVSEEEANVSTKFGEKYIHVKGVDKEESREKMARYVLQYLENPNKKAEDKAKREAYEKLPPKEKLADLVAKINERNPDFKYEWTAWDKGNVKAKYGDNSLMMYGIDNEGAREEWAYAIIQIQKEIDKTSKQDG